MAVCINAPGLSRFDHQLRHSSFHKPSERRVERLMNEFQLTSSLETIASIWLVSRFILSQPSDWPTSVGSPSIQERKFISGDQHQNGSKPLQDSIANSIKKPSGVPATSGSRSQDIVGDGQVASRHSLFKSRMFSGHLHKGDSSSYSYRSSYSGATILFRHNSVKQNGGCKDLNTREANSAPLMDHGFDDQLNMSQPDTSPQAHYQRSMQESHNLCPWLNDRHHLPCQDVPCSMEVYLRASPAFIEPKSIKVSDSPRVRAMSDRKVKYINIRRQWRTATSAPVFNVWIYRMLIDSFQAYYRLDTATGGVMMDRDLQTIVGTDRQGRSNTATELQPLRPLASRARLSLEVRGGFPVWSKGQQRSPAMDAGNGAGSSTSGNARPEKCSRPFAVSQPGECSAKRKGRNSCQDGEEDQGSDDTPSSQGPDMKRPRHEPNSRAFACPYYKLDPMKNHRCLNYKLSKISYVKQHLWRCHANPQYYCPVCCGDFNHRQEWDQHVITRGCESRPSTFQYMTEAQKKEIQGTTGRKMTQEQKWYEIWTILFGASARMPDSPYIEEHIFVEAISSVRTFCRDSGSHLITEGLRQANGRRLNVLEFFDQVLENVQHYALRQSRGLPSSSSFNTTIRPSAPYFQDESNPDAQCTNMSGAGLTTSTSCVDLGPGPAYPRFSELGIVERGETVMGDMQTMTTGYNAPVDNTISWQGWPISAFGPGLPSEFPVEPGYIPDCAYYLDQHSQTEASAMITGVPDNVDLWVLNCCKNAD